MSDMGWGRDRKVCANAQHVMSIQKPIMPLGSQVSNEQLFIINFSCIVED